MQWYSGQGNLLWIIIGAIGIVTFTPVTDHLSVQWRVLIPLLLGVALLFDSMGLFDRWSTLTPVEPADVEASTSWHKLLLNSDVLIAIGLGAWGVARWRAEASDAYIWFVVAGLFVLSICWRVMIRRASWEDARR